MWDVMCSMQGGNGAFEALIDMPSKVFDADIGRRPQALEFSLSFYISCQCLSSLLFPPNGAASCLLWGTRALTHAIGIEQTSQLAVVCDGLNGVLCATWPRLLRAAANV